VDVERDPVDRDRRAALDQGFASGADKTLAMAWHKQSATPVSMLIVSVASDKAR